MIRDLVKIGRLYSAFSGRSGPRSRQLDRDEIEMREIEPGVFVPATQRRRNPIVDAINTATIVKQSFGRLSEVLYDED